MIKHGSVSLDWADGHYTFRLGIGEWRELKDKTGAGPYELYERVVRRRWLVDDLREIIRLGLIGGGMEPPAALKLISFYVDERPLLESVPVALEIMSGALVTPEGEEPKKEKRRSKGKARSASPTYTERVQ